MSDTSDIEPARSGQRAATGALLLATLFWGSGFVWAKTAGATINSITGAGAGAAIGPIWVLTVRFAMAGVLWLIVFPASRRGWNRSVVIRSFILGSMVAAGMIVQHLGLDRTTEAVSAFLTSLTILFVPLMMTFLLRRPPGRIVWVGVALAGGGVWLMTGASASGFGLGEALGVSCAIIYSIDTIAVSLLINPANTQPITAGQFLVVSLYSALTCVFLPHGPDALSGTSIARFMSTPAIGWNVLLLGVVVSMGAFGLQFRFQPLLDPTRAALLYLMEPIFASLYAWIARGRGLTRLEMLGAALILLANVLVEVIQARTRKAEEVDAGKAPALID